MALRPSFYDVIRQAVQDMSVHGYDSSERVAYWIEKIRRAAVDHLIPEATLQEQLKQHLGAIYQRLVERGKITHLMPGVPRFTRDKVRPALRSALDRAIMASANMIKRNRTQAVAMALQRFEGWSTSIPVGGSRAVDAPQVQRDIRKSLTQLPFEERRVLIDQGHKFTSELSSILATDGGALAAIWHSHWRQTHYNYRKDHKERDEKVYAIRGNWALATGLMKPGPAGYTDQITKPAEEVFCRCFYEYIFNITSLPDDMITKKGREEIERTQAQVRAMARA